ncbi:hypothetical protein FACS189472_13310 [Alphaproteobacteria bacterium]|nr:hypothetical protein FACS189472_13310 [Alphaproteobacteria bacterium]
MGDSDGKVGLGVNAELAKALVLCANTERDLGQKTGNVNFDGLDTSSLTTEFSNFPPLPLPLPLVFLLKQGRSFREILRPLLLPSLLLPTTLFSPFKS